METMLYPEKKGSDRVRVECGKCDGTGSVSWGVNVDGAVREASGRTRIVPKVCFACNGVGSSSVLVSSLRATARRQERAAAEAARRAAEYAARAAAQRAEEEAREAAEAAAKEAERLAAEPVPTGRVVITGEVVSLRSQESTFGYSTQIVTKVLVKDDRGFKVWGSLPTALADALYGRWYDAEKAAVEADGFEFWTGNYGPDYWHRSARGARVTFTAAVEPSRDDDRFGFFKRPTKARIV